jgi:hypothetical protein
MILGKGSLMKEVYKEGNTTTQSSTITMAHSLGLHQESYSTFTSAVRSYSLCPSTPRFLTFHPSVYISICLSAVIVYVSHLSSHRLTES